MVHESDPAVSALQQLLRRNDAAGVVVDDDLRQRVEIVGRAEADGGEQRDELLHVIRERILHLDENAVRIPDDFADDILLLRVGHIHGQAAAALLAGGFDSGHVAGPELVAFPGGAHAGRDERDAAGPFRNRRRRAALFGAPAAPARPVVDLPDHLHGAPPDSFVNVFRVVQNPAHGPDGDARHPGDVAYRIISHILPLCSSVHQVLFIDHRY